MRKLRRLIKRRKVRLRRHRGVARGEWVRTIPKHGNRRIAKANKATHGKQVNRLVKRAVRFYKQTGGRQVPV